MEIELKQFESGKKLTFKNDQSNLHLNIKQLLAQRKYEEIFKVANSMQQSIQKYFIATNALMHMRDWKKLVQYCDRGFKLSQQCQFYHLKGKALGKLGDNEQRIQLILKAIAINPNISAFHRNLGAAYYTAKEYEKAICEHIKSTELEPDNPINYHNIGTAYFRLNLYQKAYEFFEKAITLNPNQALTYSWSGDCLRYSKRYEQALARYTKAYEISNNPLYLRQKQRIIQIMSENNPNVSSSWIKERKQSI